jgi:NADPH:quinone reductase-like Zn-dependent oxidoreductase
VIGTASAARLDAVRELGAHEAVEAGAEIEPVDVVFDTAGGERLRRSEALLRPGGRLISVAEEPPGEGVFFIVEPNREQLAELARRADNGELRVPPIAAYPLASAREAFARSLEHGRPVKVVLEVAA